jgi:hypothetical protein
MLLATTMRNRVVLGEHFNVKIRTIAPRGAEMEKNERPGI